MGRDKKQKRPKKFFGVRPQEKKAQASSEPIDELDDLDELDNNQQPSTSKKRKMVSNELSEEVSQNISILEANFSSDESLDDSVTFSSVEDSENSEDRTYSPPSSRRQSLTTEKELNNGNFIFDLKLLINSLNGLIFCPTCNCDLVLFEDIRQKIGLFSKLSWKCSSSECDFKREFYNSEKKSNFEEINLRLCYGIKLIGSGETGSKTLLAAMNLPKPPSRNEKYITNILNSSELIAEQSMDKAADELKEREDNEEVTISMDGTWNTRGKQQLNFYLTFKQLFLKNRKNGQTLHSHSM